VGSFEAKISTKGQITIPSALRKQIGLRIGDSLQIELNRSGKLELSAKKKGLSHIRGIFGKPSKPINVDESIMATVWEKICQSMFLKRNDWR
jgi:AbrB family looped-hinge helix DNA binding protein